jgi:hypothetical protein
MNRKDAFFFAVPAALAVVAGALGVQAWRRRNEPPSEQSYALRPVCSPARARCREGKVQVASGEVTDAGACVFTDAQRCRARCVSEHVDLVLADAKLAAEQLCDPPAEPRRLLTEPRSFLDQPVADAGSCEGDGYVPSAEGIVQCVRRSGLDRGSDGVVMGSARCKFGVVPTEERAPALIPIEEAAALWCRRDPAGEPAPAPSVSTSGSARASSSASASVSASLSASVSASLSASARPSAIALAPLAPAASSAPPGSSAPAASGASASASPSSF